jgi:hypothetical protein
MLDRGSPCPDPAWMVMTRPFLLFTST